MVFRTFAVTLTASIFFVYAYITGYNVYREKLISAPNKVEVEKKKHFDESEILSNVPSSYKKKTKRLLHQIKNNSSIGWNDLGEFV